MKRIIFFVYISTLFLNLGAMEQALPHHPHDHSRLKNADSGKQKAIFGGVPRSPKTEERLKKGALLSHSSYQSQFPRPNLKPKPESKTQS